MRDTHFEVYTSFVDKWGRISAVIGIHVNLSSPDTIICTCLNERMCWNYTEFILTLDISVSSRQTLLQSVLHYTSNDAGFQ